MILIQEKVSPSWSLLDPNPYTWQPYEAKTKNSWVTTADYTMGKVSLNTQTETTFKHYTLNNNTNKLSRCKGCARTNTKSHSINCTITRKRNLLYNIIVDSKLNWHEQKTEGPEPNQTTQTSITLLIPPKHNFTKKIAEAFTNLREEIWTEYNELTYSKPGYLQQTWIRNS